MTAYLITTCSKEKDSRPGLLPAIERYKHPRIDWVYRESQRLNLPMLILSGEFGLLQPQTPIPWYDHALQADEVPNLVPAIALRLKGLKAESLQFFARPANEPGWAPYHAALDQACRAENVRLRWVLWES